MGNGSMSVKQVPGVLVVLLGAAGLLIILWQIAQNVLAQQFSVPLVAVGLAIAAVAEYLWWRSEPGATAAAPTNSHALISVALLVTSAFVFVSALEGGLALLRGAYADVLAVDWLAGTPFRDYTIPALVLVVVVGGSALLAALTAFVHREWALLVAMTAGLIMVGYEVVEIISMDTRVGPAALPMVLTLQLFYMTLGLAMLGMGRYLRRHEYVLHQLRPRHGERPITTTAA
jgi:hypothetical protein